MRVWIEIIVVLILSTLFLFHPLMRVWIEIKQVSDEIIAEAVSPSYEGVD